MGGLQDYAPPGFTTSPASTLDLYGTRLVLLAGFVAWCSQSGVPAPLAALAAAVDTALGRRPRAPASST